MRQNTIDDPNYSLNFSVVLQFLKIKSCYFKIKNKKNKRKKEKLP